LQYLVSLRSSSRCLPHVPRLSVPSSPPSIKCFQKAVPTQALTKPVSLPSFYFPYDVPILLDSLQQSQYLLLKIFKIHDFTLAVICRTHYIAYQMSH
jgi:hypothetical protein